MSWQVAVALFLGLAASVEDLMRRQVSNWIPVSALVAGLGIHWAERGWKGAGNSLLAAVCGFGVFLIFYMLGGMGGGDVKLMAGFGALLGAAGRLFEAAIWTAVIGGIIAGGVLAYRRWGVKSRTGGLKESIPYAPAITLGVWLELLATS